MHGSDKSVSPGMCNKFVMAWIVYCYEMIGGAAIKTCFTVMSESAMMSSDWFRGDVRTGNVVGCDVM